MPLDNKKIVGAVFLDLKAANDNVLVNILIERLSEMNIPKLISNSSTVLLQKDTLASYSTLLT
jgi:hypothetical protein